MLERAIRKTATQIPETGLPVHILRTMLRDLATLTCNEVTLPGQPDLTITAQPTPLETEAFRRFGVEPSKMNPVQLQP